MKNLLLLCLPLLLAGCASHVPGLSLGLDGYVRCMDRCGQDARHCATEFEGPASCRAQRPGCETAPAGPAREACLSQQFECALDRATPARCDERRAQCMATCAR